MDRSHPKSFSGMTSCVILLFGLFASPPARARQSASVDSSRTQTAKTISTIPPGTILPVELRTTISANRAETGQTVRGQIAQDVPLPGGSKIRKGSRIEGKVVDVTAAANGDGHRVSIRFDKLHSNGAVIPVTTALRAIAGFMEVLAAETPMQSVGESDVFNWMTTIQIGGDAVYGRGGVVTSGQSGQVVGSSLQSGGVLVQVTANSSGSCRGAINDNHTPQALWVFSSDACGTYGLSNVHILHAGRTTPVGTFTLQVDGQKAKIHNGDGWLLRVIDGIGVSEE